MCLFVFICIWIFNRTLTLVTFMGCFTWELGYGLDFTTYMGNVTLATGKLLFLTYLFIINTFHTVCSMPTCAA